MKTASTRQFNFKLDIYKGSNLKAQSNRSRSVISFQARFKVTDCNKRNKYGLTSKKWPASNLPFSERVEKMCHNAGSKVQQRKQSKRHIFEDAFSSTLFTNLHQGSAAINFLQPKYNFYK